MSKTILSKSFHLSSLIPLLFILITSCHSVKPTGGKYNPSDYESFFLGEGKTQYFIQPLIFKGEDAKFEIDFTFRDENFENSIAVANFSISSQHSITKIDSLIFNTSDLKIIASDINKIYHQKEGKKQNLRSTSNISGNQLSQIFESKNLQISVYGNNQELKFNPSKKINKKRLRIHSNLIENLINTLE